jgi:hypothetical protein
MRRPSPRALRASALALATFALLGSSPYPGGCGSPVKKSQQYTSTVDMGCDVIVNGKYDNPRCNHASTDYQTPLSSTPNSFSPSPNCTDSAYPLDCGNGYCCPSGFAYCCHDSTWCGSTADACAQVDNPSDYSPTPTPSPSPGPGPGAKQCSSWEACGNGHQMRACAQADGSGNCSAWYESDGGYQYACPSCGACQSAAQQVVSYCQNH